MTSNPKSRSASPTRDSSGASIKSTLIPEFPTSSPVNPKSEKLLSCSTRPSLVPRKACPSSVVPASTIVGSSSSTTISKKFPALGSIPGTNRITLSPSSSFALTMNCRNEPWISSPSSTWVTTLKLKPKSASWLAVSIWAMLSMRRKMMCCDVSRESASSETPASRPPNANAGFEKLGSTKSRESKSVFAKSKSPTILPVPPKVCSAMTSPPGPTVLESTTT